MPAASGSLAPAPQAPSAATHALATNCRARAHTTSNSDGVIDRLGIACAHLWQESRPLEQGSASLHRATAHL
jgi:hypothetical protein